MKRIKGTVESMADLTYDNKASYGIISEGEKYIVTSEGKQALKDLIFIRKGQQVCIDADVSGRTLKAISSVIDIGTISQTREDNK
ncbi:MAG: hypothetical protein J5829_02060 [Lachnospiraceae bacterium]|nr:hypothetical protein [Lachnospiraceae bacterium]